MALSDTFPYRNLDLGITGQVVRANNCILDNYFISNVAATARFVKFYDKATAATTADTPVKTICIPATSSANVSGLGWRFLNGLSVRASNLVADADATAPTANDVVVNFGMS